MDAKLSNAEHQLAGQEREISRLQRACEKSLAGRPELNWTSDRAVAAGLALDASLTGEFHQDPPKSEKYTYLMENGPVVVESRPQESVQPEWKDGAGQYAPGRTGQAAVFDGKRCIEVGQIANFGFYDPFTLAAWIYPTAGTGAIVPRAQDQPEGQGFGLYLKTNRLQRPWFSAGSMTEPVWRAKLPFR